MKALVTAALAAFLVVASVQASADAAKPSGSKASSYAPRPKAKNGVYGAPIQPPIMGHRKSARHKASSTLKANSTHMASSTKKAGSKKKPGPSKAHDKPRPRAKSSQEKSTDEVFEQPRPGV